MYRYTHPYPPIVGFFVENCHYFKPIHRYNQVFLSKIAKQTEVSFYRCHTGGILQEISDGDERHAKFADIGNQGLRFSPFPALHFCAAKRTDSHTSSRPFSEPLSVAENAQSSDYLTRCVSSVLCSESFVLCALSGCFRVRKVEFDLAFHAVICNFAEVKCYFTEV